MGKRHGIYHALPLAARVLVCVCDLYTDRFCELFCSCYLVLLVAVHQCERQEFGHERGLRQ